jgi:hypothetical protein
MITIELPSGEKATVNDGEWVVEDNEELARVLNDPTMQPPRDGHYAPSEDARMAEHVLKTWGGKWLKTDEQSEPGKLY